MDVLVTGAASKAGVQIVSRLQTEGARVRSAFHLAAGEGEIAPGQVAIDFLRPETLDAAFSGIEAAVLIVPEDSRMTAMTANLVAAAERADVLRIAYMSFLHADSGVGGPLLAWHRGAERVVAASALPSTCLRPNYYMQNFLSATAPAASMGGGSVSYIDASDVADAVAGVVMRGGGHENMTYSLTGPRALSMAEVAELLRGEVGPVLTYAGRGWEEACFRGRRSAQSTLTQALCEFWVAASEDLFATVTSDFEQLTGRSPKHFEVFVREHRGELRAVRAA